MIYEYALYDIICDVCGIDGSNTTKNQWGFPDPEDVEDYFFTLGSNTIGKRSMRRIAKQHGWIYHDHKDICPKCRKEMEASSE